jgi:hypothetical protein
MVSGATRGKSFRKKVSSASVTRTYPPRASAKGHFDPFPPPRLNDRYEGCAMTGRLWDGGNRRG